MTEDFNDAYAGMWKEYTSLRESLELKNTNLNFFSYLLYKSVSAYGMAPFVVIFGAERIGKSTLGLQAMKRYYYMKYMVEGKLPRKETFALFPDMIPERLTLYEDYSNYKTNQREYFMNDEGILSHDKRDWVKRRNINQLKILNVYADNNNVLTTLIQYLGDLEVRLVKRANFLILVHERGSALVFQPMKNFSFFNYVTTVEKVKERPEMIYNENIVYRLKHMRDFAFEIRFSELKKDMFWESYAKTKREGREAQME